MRLYSAGEQGVVQKALAVKQDAQTSQGSLSMVLGMFAFVAVGGLAAAVVMKRATRRSTRHVSLVEPPADEELSLNNSDEEMLLE